MKLSKKTREMKNKGELQMTVIQLAIAIVVLVLVVFGIGYYFKDYIIPAGKNLPNPIINIDGDGKSLKIFRYVLDSREVDYYTGTEWINIKELQEVEWRDRNGKTKIIYGGTLMKNFDDFYSIEREKKSISIGAKKALIEGSYLSANYEGIGETSNYVVVNYLSDRYIINYKGDLYRQEKEPLKENVGKVIVTDTISSGFGGEEKIKIAKIIIDKTKQGYTKSGDEIRKYLDKLNNIEFEPLINLPEKVKLEEEYEIGFMDRKGNIVSYKIYHQKKNTGIFIELSVIKEGKIERIYGGDIKAEAEFTRKFRIVKESDQNKNEKEIVREVNQWIDEVLKNPIEISVYDVSGKEKLLEKKNYCTKSVLVFSDKSRKIEKSLVIDMDKEVDENEKCGVET